MVKSKGGPGDAVVVGGVPVTGVVTQKASLFSASGSTNFNFGGVI